MSTPQGPDETPTYPGEPWPRTPPTYPPEPGYPPYPQYTPGYPVYPQPGYAGPPPMPSKRSNRTLWIVLGSVGGILLLICIGCGILLFALGQRVANNPLIASTYTVGLFCGYEQQQDYRAAYALFSPSLQAKTTADKFVQDSQARDAASGVVQSCQTATSGGSVPQSGDTTASFELEVARKGGTTVTGTITLVKVDSGWKIDSVDPSLSLV